MMFSVMKPSSHSNSSQGFDLQDELTRRATNKLLKDFWVIILHPGGGVCAAYGAWLNKRRRCLCSEWIPSPSSLISSLWFQSFPTVRASPRSYLSVLRKEMVMSALVFEFNSSWIMMNMKRILSFITRLKASADKWLLHTVSRPRYTIILATTPASITASYQTQKVPVYILTVRSESS